MGKGDSKASRDKSFKLPRDAVSGQIAQRAQDWANANSSSRDIATSKLKEMGILDARGKLAKDYR